MEERVTKLDKIITGGLLEATLNAGAVVEVTTSAASVEARAMSVGAMSMLARRIAEGDTEESERALAGVEQLCCAEGGKPCSVTRWVRKWLRWVGLRAVRTA